MHPLKQIRGVWASLSSSLSPILTPQIHLGLRFAGSRHTAAKLAVEEAGLDRRASEVVAKEIHGAKH